MRLGFFALLFVYNIYIAAIPCDVSGNKHIVCSKQTDEFKTFIGNQNK